jgi:hypothetical protein
MTTDLNQEMMEALNQLNQQFEEQSELSVELRQAQKTDDSDEEEIPLRPQKRSLSDAIKELKVSLRPPQKKVQRVDNYGIYVLLNVSCCSCYPSTDQETVWKINNYHIVHLLGSIAPREIVDVILDYCGDSKPISMHTKHFPKYSVKTLAKVKCCKHDPRNAEHLDHMLMAIMPKGLMMLVFEYCGDLKPKPSASMELFPESATPVRKSYGVVSDVLERLNNVPVRVSDMSQKLWDAQFSERTQGKPPAIVSLPKKRQVEEKSGTPWALIAKSGQSSDKKQSDKITTDSKKRKDSCTPPRGSSRDPQTPPRSDRGVVFTKSTGSHAPKKRKEERKCSQCKQEFQGLPNERFCSVECSDRYARICEIERERYGDDPMSYWFNSEHSDDY